jgi:hypothetical protein
MYIHDTTKMQYLQTTTLTKTRKLNTTNYFIGKKHCKFLTNRNPSKNQTKQWVFNPPPKTKKYYNNHLKNLI